MTTIHCYPFPTDWENMNLVLSISNKKRKEFEAIPTGETNIQRGIVARDLTTGKWFAIRNFPCFAYSFDCCCAAQAKQLASEHEKWEWPPVEFLKEDEEE